MSPEVALLAALRAAHVAALLVAFGALLLPTVAGRATGLVERTTHRLAGGGLVLAFATGSLWFVLQAASFANATDAGAVIDALPGTAGTRFGQVLLLRLVLLLGALALHRPRCPAWLAPVPAGIAVALQPLLGHAGAQSGLLGWSLCGTEAVHLLAAGAWIGALPPLLVAVARLPTPMAATLCRRFSPIGIGAVALLAGTGLAQGSALIGGMPGLFGTPYGRLALVKLALFVLMLGLAAANRLWLVDRLDGPRPARARAVLRNAILGETALGGLVVIAAASMANLPPGLHEQPLWPFAWQISGLALRDEDLRVEIANALLMVGLSVALLANALYWGRLRLVAVLISGGLLATWLPSFGLFLVPAHPTSFYTSPTRFAVQDIVQGQALFRENCVSCHGADGSGAGAQTTGASIRPADLTAPHLFDHPDGEMFWWLTDGIRAPDGSAAMPAFAETLSEADRWDLIDYLRAHNAGLAFRGSGAPPVPIPAPDLPVRCPDPRIARLARRPGGGRPVAPRADDDPAAGGSARHGRPAALRPGGMQRAQRGCLARFRDPCRAAARNPGGDDVPGGCGWLAPRDPSSRRPAGLVRSRADRGGAARHLHPTPHSLRRRSA